MSNKKVVNRRDMMKLLAGLSVGALTVRSAAAESKVGAIIPGKGWVKASGEQCADDGTPLQFIPKTAPEESPLKDELKNHVACPYCGMNRTKWNHSRHLVHYDDGIVDGTCSIHCLAISLSLNIDRGTKAIYAPDFASTEKVKPLVEVEKATYLIGSKLKGTMTAQSKMAFASADAAKAVQTEKGGVLGSFDDALKATYLSMAQDTIMIRKRRGERRDKMMKKMKAKQG